MSNMSKMHIWVGTTNKSEEEYHEYFELDYSTEGDFDDPEYKICQFCKDIGEKWYDEDMIGIVPLFPSIQPVAILLEKTPIDKGEIENAVNAANQAGVDSGNAVFYYTDSELHIEEPYKENYNDLKYIGVYNSILE